MKKIIALLAIFTFFSFKLYQVDNWEKDLQAMLYEFMTCGGPTAPNTPCNEFLGKALKRVYGITDFDKANGQYMRANEIADYVSLNPDKWTLLGKGSDQNALDQAQGYANVKKAIIAVYKAPAGSGHVALIIPGKLTYSGSWELKCPNSASFFIDHALDAYISKPLAQAFGAAKKDKVLLYGRNY